MPTVDLSIYRTKAEWEDTPIWPEINLENVVDAGDAPWRVALLAEGMESGEPSVALCIRLPDGQEMIVETSLYAWSSVVIAARAAFPDAFANGPLDPHIDIINEPGVN